MNKQLLPIAKDRIQILYIDSAEIRQKEYSVILVKDSEEFDIPIANIQCIILGPGTSITHNAVKQISEYGCSIIWSGEDIHFYYALGEPLTRYSDNILKQCKCHESKMLFNQVVHNMYRIRYPDLRLQTKSIDEIKGIEGNIMQDLYRELAYKNNIQWNGRTYHVIDFNKQDEINKAITSANQMLYAIILCTINAIGYSPAIGFIHTGQMLSFVYDIADLYKERLILPNVFKYIGEKQIYNSKDVKDLAYSTLISNKIVDKIILDLEVVFSI